MFRSIMFKEWLKMRYFLLLGLFGSMGLVTYLLLNIRNILMTRDAVEVISHMIGRDIIYVNALQYIPLVLGVLLGVCQWLPEMIQKRIKLTLHLPVPFTYSIGSMLCFGLCYMLLIGISNILCIFFTEMHWFPYELVRHTFMPLVVWYLAGIVGYLFCSWVLLEPTWKVRIYDLLISMVSLAVFFQSPQPEVYNSFLPILVGAATLFITFPLYSVYRFKIGKGL